jgi:hypothetical protein
VLIPVAAFLRDGLRAFKNPFLYAAPVIAVLAFVAGTPFLLVDFKLFIKDMSREAHHYATGHAGMEGHAPQWYARWLFDETGVPGALLILCGALASARARSRGYLLLAVFPCIYLVFISSFVVRNARTALPLVASLTILEAWGVIEVCVALQNRFGHRLTRLACFGGSALLLGWVSWRTFATLRPSEPDSRDTGRIWIANNLRARARLAIEPYVPYVDPARYQVRAFESLSNKPVAWYRKNHFDYLIFSGENFDDNTQAADYYALFSQMKPVQVFKGAGPEIRIYEIRSRQN